MRREFRLPDQDEIFLNDHVHVWETILDGGVRWLLIHELPVPSGYNISSATAAIRIEANYPPGQLDMVYFSPALARTDGRAIRALSSQCIQGAEYQRWSRHYPWKPAKDSLSSHVLRIQHWVEDELKRG